MLTFLSKKKKAAHTSDNVSVEDKKLRGCKKEANKEHKGAVKRVQSGEAVARKECPEDLK